MRAIVAGGGVVGVSLARSLAISGFETILIEQNKALGMETSSRNSEVIHAGLYYAENSMKARTCVEGRRLLYDFCDEFNVPYKNCGKLIVATEESQLKTLEQLQESMSLF